MCDKTPHFDKAPIVEAVIGIDLEEMLGEDALSILDSLGRELKPSYPIQENMMMGEVKFEIGSQPRQTDTHLGYFYKTNDGLQIVHARRNGFAFSRLAPYQSWDEFIAEAKKTWMIYQQFIEPSKLLRWTIRYINKFSWPQNESIENYLTVYPHIPDDLPQMLQGCFMRLQVPIHDPQQGLLTQQIVSLPQPDQADKVSFILDNEFVFAAIGMSSSEIWEKVHACRKVKNEFFTKSITSKTKEMIS